MSISGPSEPGWLQTFKWVVRPTNYLDECFTKYGPVFRVHLTGWADHIIVADPEIVRQVLQAPRDVLLTGQSNEIMAPVLGWESIFLKDFDAHRAIRREVIHGISTEAIDATVRATGPLIDQLISEAGKQDDFDLGHLCRQIATANVLTLITGSTDIRSVQRIEKLISDLQGAAVTVLAFARQLQRYRGWGSPWRWLQSRRQSLRSALEPLLESPRMIDASVPSIAMRSRSDNQTTLAVDDREVAYERLMSLVLAGYDTLATGLSWTVCWAASEEEVRTRLIDIARSGPEVEEGDSGVGYYDAVFLEALRIMPTVEIVSRTPRETFAVNGVEVPNGTLISPCTYLVHRNPEVFPEPLAFKPQRFLNGRPKPWEFFPFGLGGRSCVGSNISAAQTRQVLRKLIGEQRINPVRMFNAKPSRRHVTIQPAHTNFLRIVN